MFIKIPNQRAIQLLIVTLWLYTHPSYSVAPPQWTEHLDWTTYLHSHPGYQGYNPPTDIIKQGCAWGSWITFPQKIEAILAKVGDFTYPIELFRSKDFVVMYKHPEYYQKHILNYLVGKEFPLAHKIIAIYASAPGALCQPAYELYKAHKIDIKILELVFAINCSGYIYSRHTGLCYTNVKEALQGTELYNQLPVCIKGIPPKEPLSKDLQILLNNQMPKTWYKFPIFNSLANDSYYTYRDVLPFKHILTQAVQARKEWQQLLVGSPLNIMEIAPYFLMLMEHPQRYYPTRLGLTVKKSYGLKVLRNKKYTDDEKSMTIFGMSQLGVFNPYESFNYYADIIEGACEWYRKGALTVDHLYQLFKCDFPTFYKYPFFILDYKKESVQDALAKFIAEPTIPEGLKAMARKVKNGTLATKEEMDYMEGYRAFRKNPLYLI